MNFLKKIDMFGQQIQFNFNKKTKHKTLLGALFSFFLIILVILSIYYFGEEVIIRKNPITLKTEVYVSQPEAIALTQKNFPFAFGLQDGDTYEHYIDEEIYIPVI